MLLLPLQHSLSGTAHCALLHSTLPGSHATPPVGPTQGPASCSSFELLDEPAFVLLLPPVEIVDEDVPPEDAVWLALLSLWRLLFAHGPPPQPELELEVVPLEELPPVPLVLLLKKGDSKREVMMH